MVNDNNDILDVQGRVDVIFQVFRESGDIRHNNVLATQPLDDKKSVTISIGKIF
jgi:hypothetical protein